MPETQSGPTLTNVTRIGRLIVKYGIIFLVVMMVGRVTINAFYAYWKAANPPPPPPPTVGFGILPAIRFPIQSDENKPISYVLETATGQLPEFSDRAKVFLYTPSAPNLLADERSKSIASSFGFVFEPNVLDSRNYRWTKSNPLDSVLEIDIQTLHFKITTDYLSRPDLLVDKRLPSDYDSVSIVKNFLRSANMLPSDVATASGEIVYFRTAGDELKPAVTRNDADFIQVDLNRFPIDGQFRMFTADGYNGTIHALLAGKFSGPQNIIHYEHQYTPIEYQLVHTYPLRTTRSAWQVLQSGEGFIVQSSTSDRAVVRSVSLAYFDDSTNQQYLQPIYVFENSEDGFLAFVSAIDPGFSQTSF